MITASGGSTPMLCEASLAWARVASLTMGAAAAANAAARRNARRGISERSELESDTGNYPPWIAAAGGSAVGSRINAGGWLAKLRQSQPESRRRANAVAQVHKPRTEMLSPGLFSPQGGVGGWAVRRM